MPRALPSMTTRSSISRRVNSVTLPRCDLPHQRLIGAEQQLLAGLAARVERARDLRAAERAVVEQAAASRANGTPCATHWSMMLTLTLRQAVARWLRASG